MGVEASWDSRWSLAYSARSQSMDFTCWVWASSVKALASCDWINALCLVYFAQIVHLHLSWFRCLMARLHLPLYTREKVERLAAPEGLQDL